MSIELVMPSNHLILCRALLLLPSIFPSIKVFSKESVLCIRCPKYWSFSFSISLSKWIFRTDFLEDWLLWSPRSPRCSQESFKGTMLKEASPKTIYYMIQFIWHSEKSKTIGMGIRSVIDYQGLGVWAGLYHNETAWRICLGDTVSFPGCGGC